MKKKLVVLWFGFKRVMVTILPVSFLCLVLPWVVWPIKRKYMMAGKSLSSKNKVFFEGLDICIVYGVQGRNYVGEYVYGILISGLIFPKVSTRELNEEERKKYDGQSYGINGMPMWRIELSK